jgi:hypothetical protein
MWILRDLLVNRTHVIALAPVMEDAHDGGVGAVDDAQDAAFGSPVAAHVAHFDQYAVAVHGGADSAGIDEDVAIEPLAQFLAFGGDEAVTVAVHAQAAGDQVAGGGGGGQGIEIIFRLQQLPARDQVVQVLGEEAAVVAAQAEFVDELLEAGRAARLAADLGEDGGMGKHGG